MTSRPHRSARSTSLWFYTALALCAALGGCAAATGTKSSDATLSALTASVGTLSPAFSAGVTSYTLWIGGSSDLTITPTTSDAKAKYAINPAQTATYSDGEHAVTVTVTAEDGTTTKAYSIDVIKGNFVTISAPNTATITSSTFTASGSYYVSTMPSVFTVSFGSTADLPVTVNASDNTWSATIDASALANGSPKSLALRAQWAASTKWAYRDYAYTGSPSVPGYSITGTISFPAGATIPTGEYLSVWADGGSGGQSSASSMDITLTSATSYTYTLSGLAAGIYTVFAETHDATWSGNPLFTHFGVLSAAATTTITTADGSSSFMMDVAD